jgi:hypothetical protein
MSASNRAIQHFPLEDRDMNKLILAILITLCGTGSAMATDSEFRHPMISDALQSQIDKKIEASLQQKMLDFSNASYVAQKQVKTNKAS